MKHFLVKSERCCKQTFFSVMRNLRFTSYFFVVLLACQSCLDIFDNNCEPVTGDVVEQELNIAPFTKFSLAINANVFISEGAEQEVRIEAAESIIQELLTDVNNNRWDIEYDDCLKQSNDISSKIYITVPEIESIGLSGSGEIVMLDTFEGESLALNISGSGDITGKFIGNSINCSISGAGDILLNGSVETQIINISGSGNIWSYDLLTTESAISIAGSGTAKVSPSEKLNINISGSGNVYYKGSPTISEAISGSGKVVKED